MIIVTMKARLKEEHRDTALEAACKVSDDTLKEAGCIDYRFWVSPTDPNTLLLLEQWEDQAALDVHMTQPSLGELGAALGPALDGAPDVIKHEVSGFGPLFG